MKLPRLQHQSGQIRLPTLHGSRRIRDDCAKQTPIFKDWIDNPHESCDFPRDRDTCQTPFEDSTSRDPVIAAPLKTSNNQEMRYHLDEARPRPAESLQCLHKCPIQYLKQIAVYQRPGITEYPQGWSRFAVGLYVAHHQALLPSCGPSQNQSWTTRKLHDGFINRPPRRQSPDVQDARAA